MPHNLLYVKTQKIQMHNCPFHSPGMSRYFFFISNISMLSYLDASDARPSLRSIKANIKSEPILCNTACVHGAVVTHLETDGNWKIYVKDCRELARFILHQRQQNHTNPFDPNLPSKIKGEKICCSPSLT